MPRDRAVIRGTLEPPGAFYQDSGGAASYPCG